MDSFPRSEIREPAGCWAPEGRAACKQQRRAQGAGWMEDKTLPSIESHFFVLVQKSPNPTVV